MTISVPIGGQIDMQVQALFGSYKATATGHQILWLPTYDFTFDGTTSDWSSTQSLTYDGINYNCTNIVIDTSEPSPSIPPSVTLTPTVPEFPIFVVVPLLLSAFSIAVIVGRRESPRSKPHF